MSRYKAYSESKSSGEEWLGFVPADWRVIQIKHLSIVKRGASPRPIDDQKYFDDEGEYAWTRIADVTASDVYLTQAPQKLSNLGSSLSVKLEPGALFLSIAGTVGKPCIAAIKACIHDGFVYFPGLKIPSKFLFYIFAAEQAYKGLGKFGTQLNLNTDTVGGIKIGCTRNEELETIVAFLDHETAKIDALIEKQQRLIELLKEKRQAVISHAVTKGLNPNAPVKDSGVEWLGEVPAHWVVAKLSFRYEVLLGKMLDDKKITGNFLGSYLRNTDVQWARINTEDLPQMDFYPNEQDRYSVKKLDLIVCEGGEIGRCAIWENDEPCFYQKALHRLRPLNANRDMTRFMFYHLFNAVHQERFISSAGKSTIAHLPAETFRQFRFVYPTLTEQVGISSFLDEQKLKFDALETNALSQISLLQERRTALISAAVTGKIDLRDWQPAAAQAVVGVAC